MKEGTLFSFDLQVTNLSQVELGALVWLLTLPAEHFHRLGLGKPFGFGSVRLDIDDEETRVCDAAGWKEIYGTLDEVLPKNGPTGTDLQTARNEFEKALKQAYPNDAERILKSFQVAAAGVPGKPVHYPRLGQPGDGPAAKPHRRGVPVVRQKRLGR